MKILVTGGAGFIGSHIVDLALLRGHEVVVVDDLSGGSRDNIHPAAAFHQLSIGDAELGRVLAAERPEVICHQAAQTSVTRSIEDPQYDAEVNTRGSLNVLGCGVKAGIRKVVYASSCAIYGNPQQLPVAEKHPICPLSPYGVSKYAVELYLQVYQSLYGLAFVALRYSNVFGPRQRSNGEAGVVPLFAHEMLCGRQPTIFGAGDKTRSYVYVEDVARANLTAIESACQGVFNIGTPEQTPDQAVFDALGAELDFRGLPRYELMRPGEITHMSLDCRKASGELGWSSRVSFAQGIRLAASYYRSAAVPGGRP